MRGSDTDGRALLLEPHSASIRDRNAAGPVLRASRSLYMFIVHLFADSAYAGELIAEATDIEFEIVRKLAWPGRLRPAAAALGGRTLLRLDRSHRRLAKDVEATIDSARAFLYAAAVMLLVRRIARQHDFPDEL